MSNEHELRHHLRYRTLAAFHLTAEARSATRAAELLGITQPAVSQLLAGLERAVGFPLFARGAGRGLEPTPEARELLADVRRVLESMTALERCVRAMTEVDEPGAAGLRHGGAPK
ncbi:LysR family transcriptional regulator [Stella sp.]|uniref:LysR family transcriptional regulator n=1 Tax=Stella sp. TaxID=2912054 RepID=UPI0035B2D771